MRYSKEQINERFQMLPSSVQDVVLSAEVADAIKAIAEKNDLHIDTAGLLNEEITFVMVGAEKSVNFIKNLKVHLRIPEDKINAVAGDVNEKIFLPVREALRNAANKSAQDIKSKLIDNSNLHKKEIELENKIDHASLTESEEIRQYVQAKQMAKHTTPPPQNLPIDTSVDTLDKVPTETPIEQKKEPQKPSFDGNKPFHVDPYREPLE